VFDVLLAGSNGVWMLHCWWHCIAVVASDWVDNLIPLSLINTFDSLLRFLNRISKFGDCRSGGTIYLLQDSIQGKVVHKEAGLGSRPTRGMLCLTVETE
jgi:hypothetical protein